MLGLNSWAQTCLLPQPPEMLEPQLDATVPAKTRIALALGIYFQFLHELMNSQLINMSNFKASTYTSEQSGEKVM